VGEPFHKFIIKFSHLFFKKKKKKKNNKGKEKKRKISSECMEALDEGKKGSPEMQVSSISLIM
jgi:hypothetical protein